MNFGFRVVSFNIRHYWADDGENSWERRSPILARVLRDNRAEIVCFQEVNNPVFDFLSQAMKGYLVASDREDRGPRWEYRPVYVGEPFRIIEFETFSLSQTPHLPSKSWGSNFIRQATRVLLDLDGTSLAVYNTHLDFEEEVQFNQAQVIWRTIRDKDRDRPVILTGDFNSTPAEKAYRFLTGREEQRGLKGDLIDSMARPRPNTFHGFNDESDKGCIDWILYRGPGLRLVRPARIIEDRPQGRFPSDHYPVVAAFELPAKERKVPDAGSADGED